MIPTAEPFLTAEIAFRQQRVREQYTRRPRRPDRYRVRRRHGLRLPFTHRRPLALA